MVDRTESGRIRLRRFGADRNGSDRAVCSNRARRAPPRRRDGQDVGAGEEAFGVEHRDDFVVVQQAALHDAADAGKGREPGCVVGAGRGAASLGGARAVLVREPLDSLNVAGARLEKTLDLVDGEPDKPMTGPKDHRVVRQFGVPARHAVGKGAEVEHGHQKAPQRQRAEKAGCGVQQRPERLHPAAFGEIRDGDSDACLPAPGDPET
nr:hypothetical protein [Rhodovulum sp. 12E13]